MRVPLFLAFLFLSCGSPALEARLREGDVIFQSNRSRQMLAIQRATRSPYSHVGLVSRRNGRWGVFEAVGPVKFTPLREWIARGVDGHFVVKRLKPDISLDRETMENLRREAAKLGGKPYDLKFLWDDQAIYCSELVWKVFKRGAQVELCPLKKYRDFDLSDPLVKTLIRERFGGKAPLEEPVVAPVDLFESNKLIEITRTEKGG